MTVHVSSKPADGASRLPAAAWLVLGIVLVADIMDLLDATITTIAAPTISSSLRNPARRRRSRTGSPEIATDYALECSVIDSGPSLWGGAPALSGLSPAIAANGRECAAMQTVLRGLRRAQRRRAGTVLLDLGHRRGASVNASCAHSSAWSRSPVRRIRVATTRPRSSRKAAFTAC